MKKPYPFAMSMLRWAPGSSAVQPCASWQQVSSEHKRKILVLGLGLPTPISKLCFLRLFLSLTGSFHAKVTQTPGYLVKRKGQKTEMDCTPEKGHTFVYWYQQNQNKELTFLISFQNEQILEETEIHKKRFLSQCPRNSPCSLTILASDPGDRALYLCASSQSTALKCQFLSAHKLVIDPAQEAAVPKL
ncbi:hypothetical protein P7K49_025814 [Saguinus oedipus]|uniref:Ig-like domain-containing protein n=1 Tax=Saguinus oedipus TaxID=9490 RepID=A0ABQ9UJ23_SAGOE|nr:hypothetical protein P7K49_025814 [Saguinus oedipus]